MNERFNRGSVTLLLALVMALTIAGPAGAGATQTGGGTLLHQGDAWGSHAFVGDVILAGKSAKVGLGCATGPGVHKENSTLGVNVPPIITSGTVSSTADTFLEDGTSTTTTSSVVQGLALLDPGIPPPLITADAVRAKSSTSFDGAAFDTSAAGSGFLNLVILGIPITPNPAPNTEVPLPGIGRVVLNEQIESITPRSASLVVNMIHVFVTELGDPLGIPTGSEIIVAHAKSGLRTGLAGTLSGRAYITRAAVGDVVTSGPTALVGVGCLGGDNENNIVSADFPPLFSVGEGETTAQGSVSANGATVRTTATVQNADVLSGLVTAEAITAVASGELAGGDKTFSSEGSGFVNLFVGDDLVVNPEPNTMIPLPGVGTLWLYRVIERPNAIEVRMIELIVEDPGIPGVPAGTNIRVAVAGAGID